MFEASEAAFALVSCSHRGSECSVQSDGVRSLVEALDGHLHVDRHLLDGHRLVGHRIDLAFRMSLRHSSMFWIWFQVRRVAAERKVIRLLRLGVAALAEGALRSGALSALKG